MKVLMKKNDLLIFGTGTLAEIAGYYFNTDSSFRVIGFVDKPEFAEKKSTLMDLPIISWEKDLDQYSKSDVSFFIANGYQKTNSVRQENYEQIKKKGYNLVLRNNYQVHFNGIPSVLPTKKFPKKNRLEYTSNLIFKKK